MDNPVICMLHIVNRVVSRKMHSQMCVSRGPHRKACFLICVMALIVETNGLRPDYYPMLDEPWAISKGTEMEIMVGFDYDSQ